MSWSVHRCARCGKKLKYGNEYFIGKSAYGPKCYEVMRKKQLEFDTLVNRRLERADS